MENFMMAFIQGVYPFSVSAVILVALIIFSGFRLFKFLMQFIRLPLPQAAMVNKYLPVGELVVWSMFFLWAIQFLFTRGYLVSVVPLILFVIIILYLAWFGLKDIIAGVIFKTTSHLQISDHVNIAGITGKVASIGYSGIELEDYSGRVVQIPFSKIVGNIWQKQYSSQSLLSHNFLLRIPLNDEMGDLFEVMEKLRMTILAFPWSSQKKEPKISIQDENPREVLFNITIFSLDQAYFVRTEKLLEKEFNGRVVVLNPKDSELFTGRSV